MDSKVQNFKKSEMVFLFICRIQQIEEAVASISPGTNLLTKMVKKIHENTLCWEQEFLFQTCLESNCIV